MTAEATSPEHRLHGLDALRAGALLLGIFFHATIPYLVRVDAWAVDDDASVSLSLVYVITHIFRMSLFFMIAGFFARLMVERKGIEGFVKNRVIRIVLPFIAFWPIAVACGYAEATWGFSRMAAIGTPTSVQAPEPLHGVQSVPLTHLWFLYFLIIFYALAVFFRTIVGPSLFARRHAADFDRLFKALASSRGLAIVLALPLTVIFALRPNFLTTPGIPAPGAGLVPSGSVLLAYAVPFWFGWLLNRHADLLPLFERRWRSNLVTALVLTVAMLVLYSSGFPEHGAVSRAGFGACYALATWTWMLGLLGLALQKMSQRNRVVRYVADASYWIYIVHLPLVIALQILLLPLHWSPLVKFGLTCLISLPALFASYHWLVRPTWLGAWLNGRKYPRTWAARAASVQAE